MLSKHGGEEILDIHRVVGSQTFARLVRIYVGSRVGKKKRIESDEESDIYRERAFAKEIVKDRERDSKEKASEIAREREREKNRASEREIARETYREREKEREKHKHGDFVRTSLRSLGGLRRFRWDWSWEMNSIKFAPKNAPKSIA